MTTAVRMDKLTPAERIDLKADEARIKALHRPFRRDAVGDILHEGRVFGVVSIEQAQELQIILDRYPVLVELVRRLSEVSP